MLLGAAAIIDQVFALGGFGQVLLVAVSGGDLVIVMGVVLLTVILISIVNLLADLSCDARPPDPAQLKLRFGSRVGVPP